MSRFEAAFLGGHRRLIAFVMAGDPDPARSADIVLALERAGATVIEIGVPFSDPVADGPVIQRAAERALAAGANLGAALDLVRGVRSQVSAPLVLFSYANPIFRMGLRAFATRAEEAGVDGVLVVDLPVEEAEEVREELRAAGVDLILLVAPTTAEERLARGVSKASGFIYAISRLGVTGATASLAGGARELVGRIRRVTALPVAVGFGISHPDHVRQVCQWADAAVVGSSVVSLIAEHACDPRLAERVERHVRWLLDGSE